MEALDHRLFFWIYEPHPHGLTLFLVAALTACGSGWAMIALVPMLAVARLRRLTFWLTATLLLNAIVVFLIKVLVGRDRPFVALAGVHPSLSSPTDNSFPSGHATGSFAFAFFVVAVCLAARPRGPLHRAVALGVVLIATGIGISRVYLGVHFPGDVTAGAILGASLGYVGGRLYAMRSRTPPGLLTNRVSSAGTGKSYS